jgi:single-strand DNA-binding protein
VIAAVVSGNLGADASLKRIAGDTVVVSMNLASSVHVKGQAHTDWVSVSMFGSRAEKLVPFLRKGKAVVVRGSLTVREYKKKSGETGLSLDLRANDIELVGGRDPAPRVDVPDLANAVAVSEDSIPF